MDAKSAAIEDEAERCELEDVVELASTSLVMIAIQPLEDVQGAISKRATVFRWLRFRYPFEIMATI
jgi:hypothetical protein